MLYIYNFYPLAFSVNNICTIYRMNSLIKTGCLIIALVALLEVNRQGADSK